MTKAHTAPIDIDYVREAGFFDRLSYTNDSDCLLWDRATDKDGYGVMWDGSGMRRAHRIAWLLHHGEQVPEGQTVEHSCHQRACCNWEHLELLTHGDNAADNGWARRSQCPQGHAYDEENTYHASDGSRKCRACRQARSAARAKSRRAASPRRAG